MHELSLVAGMFEALEAEVAKYGRAKVNSVTIKVGVLSGAVPDLIESAFDTYKAGTFADGAVLTVISVKPSFRCRACGGQTFREELNYSCAACGSRDVELVSGDELIIEKVEIETEDDDEKEKGA